MLASILAGDMFAATL